MPISMSIAIAFPILGSLVPGMWPAVSSWVSRAASRFTDAASYTAAITGGTPRVSPAPAHGWDVSESVLALAVVLLSVGLAVAAIRITSGPARYLAPMRPLAAALHRAHSGHVGDYVVWLFVGLAAVTVLLRLQA
jgi:multicomponent Na+:H+ antiporter subunit D